LGIEPTFASTGFGYIQRGLALGEYRGRAVYRVLRFTEKPNAEIASRMIESGDHSWNSGMFFWRVDRILAEFQRQMPELSAGLTQIEQAWGTPAQQTVLGQVWPETPVVSIDYGIMENARDVAVLPAAGLKWSDVGSWESLFDVLDCDASGNVVMSGAHVVNLDTHDCLVYMNQVHRLIVTIGVEDLVLVDTGDVLLVCHKDQAQRVRQVVNQLKQDGIEYL
jgi:mannose-1-phosphate guanylyltransferase